MTVEQVFSLCNTAALLSWIILIAGPRWRLVTGAIEWGTVTALSVLYAGLIAVFFFRVEGGGFFSLAAVQSLFADRNAALAGWVHHLAFDLFVGLWIAARSDELWISRLIQAPILVATFMFGPFGFLLFQAIRLSMRLPGATPSPARAAS
jgi:hypothetical protein